MATKFDSNDVSGIYWRDPGYFSVNGNKEESSFYNVTLDFPVEFDVKYLSKTEDGWDNSEFSIAELPIVEKIERAIDDAEAHLG
jgi:hypothetical protein